MLDERFDDAEAELSRGEAWRFREAGAPNPLTIEVTGWSNGHTKLGEAEFLNGTDRDGNAWSVLVGSTVLRRRLIEGELDEWNEERGCYVATGSEGRVQPGEVVSIKFLGNRDNSDGMTYPAFAVVRKPASEQPRAETIETDEFEEIDPSTVEQRPAFSDDEPA